MIKEQSVKKTETFQLKYYYNGQYCFYKIHSLKLVQVAQHDLHLYL